MRLLAAAAAILAIGLVAAACGGDDATPEPADEATPAPAATEAAEEPAEEATEAPAEEEAAAETELLTKVELDQDSDPEATYGLVSGRYRMQWSTTDCEAVDLLVKQVDGDFEYPRTSTASFASATINDLPEGTYTIQQLDDTCGTWSMRVDRMSA